MQNYNYIKDFPIDVPLCNEEVSNSYIYAYNKNTSQENKIKLNDISKWFGNFFFNEEELVSDSKRKTCNLSFRYFWLYSADDGTISSEEENGDGGSGGGGSGFTKTSNRPSMLKNVQIYSDGDEYIQEKDMLGYSIKNGEKEVYVSENGDDVVTFYDFEESDSVITQRFRGESGKFYKTLVDAIEDNINNAEKVPNLNIYSNQLNSNSIITWEEVQDLIIGKYSIVNRKLNQLLNFGDIKTIRNYNSLMSGTVTFFDIKNGGYFNKIDNNKEFSDNSIKWKVHSGEKSDNQNVSLFLYEAENEDDIGIKIDGINNNNQIIIDGGNALPKHHHQIKLNPESKNVKSVIGGSVTGRQAFRMPPNNISGLGLKIHGNSTTEKIQVDYGRSAGSNDDDTDWWGCYINRDEARGESRGSLGAESTGMNFEYDGTSKELGEKVELIKEAYNNMFTISNNTDDAAGIAYVNITPETNIKEGMSPQIIEAVGPIEQDNP